MTTAPTRTTSTLLVDVPTVLSFAYRSMPLTGATTATGQPTNAISGFLSAIVDLINIERPTHAAVVLDGPGSSRRATQVPSYRPHLAPADLAAQQQILRELLQLLNVPVLEAPPGYEAADLIASLAGAAQSPVLILSTDERILQCVTDTITLIRPRLDRDPERLTPTEVHIRLGIDAGSVVDYLALRGDKPRGLAPVPGVGERSAKTWLSGAGTLDALLAEDQPRRGGLDLRNHATKLLTYRQVLRLDPTLAGHGSNDLRLAPPTTARQEIVQRFDELAMPSQGAAALKAFAGSDTDSPSTHRIPADHLTSWLTDHARSRGRHSFAIQAAPVGEAVAITTPTGTTGYFDLAQASAGDRDALAAWLCDTAVTKAVHDLKSMIHALRAESWPIDGVQIDTALAAYLLAPNAADYTLGAAAARHLEDVNPSTLNTTDNLFSPPQGGSPAAAAAQVTARLADTLLAELAHRGMAELAATIELPVAAILSDIEHRGIAVDRPHLIVLRAEFAAAAAAATAAAVEILGRPINLGSTPQLQQALFTDLGLPRTRKIRSGYSTAADELTKLLDTTEHPFLQKVLDHRAAAKLGAIIDGLLKHIETDGRIHTTLSQTTVETGRLSSLSPNLQNIPIRSAAGLRIREAFVPGPGFDYLLAADYSQIEMRIMAHASGDQHLIDAFTSGEDMHRFTAALAFGIPLDEVTDTQRSRAKAISYGLAYGQQVRGLATELNIPIAEAREHYIAYFARFGAVRDYLDALVEKARRTGYTETLFGRRRYLPDLNGDNPRATDAAERAALNAPIQGTAADIIKTAMTTVETAIRSAGLRARMILQIHDELLFEVPADEVDRLSALLREVMPRAAKFAVPLDVTVGVGRTWAAAHG
ncbi:DNA polymerase I [Nocardia salmonicida]|uniref:DNA polymerase I n=1 Tax=Nocardia salmonicida TaxID=53431 RepID=UPI0007A45AD4|nr:DNA polymerase I [Nocardia salmonicida]MBC7299532.1 DNA polymerase I [Nocardia sp.]